MLIDVNCYSLNPNYALGRWNGKVKSNKTGSFLSFDIAYTDMVKLKNEAK